MLSPGPFITVVSGLPRSGTSLMMQMLVAGGMPVLVDHIRVADTDNPEGYFEFEGVKGLEKGHLDWLEEGRGKAVKIISALLTNLPDAYSYRVIFMRRRMNEILASQRKMLVRRGEGMDAMPDEKLGAIYERHLARTDAFLASRPTMAVLNVHYNELVLDPLPAARRVSEFLGGHLDPFAMAEAVKPRLYRNREADRSDSLL